VALDLVQGGEKGAIQLLIHLLDLEGHPNARSQEQQHGDDHRAQDQQCRTAT